VKTSNVSSREIEIDVTPIPGRELTAGKISCWYENASLRYLRVGDTEVVRMIYFALRDHEWNTVPYTITRENIISDSSSFSIDLQLSIESDDISYEVSMLIEGTAANEIHVNANGIAGSRFKKNRIGLCVHHPLAECMGKPARVVHTTGAEELTAFPQFVSPLQPFLDVSSIGWQPSEHVHARLDFGGETFETEDQRNWSDASFKTYSTPLHQPFPIVVDPNDSFSHSIRLQVKIDESHATGALSQSEPNPRTLPGVGLSREYGSVPLTDLQFVHLKKLKIDFYRVELLLDDEDWKHELSNAIHEAEILETMVALAIFYSQDTQLSGVVSELRPHIYRIESVLVLQTTSVCTTTFAMQNFYPEVKGLSSSIRTGYGTNGHFAELNRNMPSTHDFDFLAFTLHPQVHANDSRTLIENLESLPHMIDTLRSQMPNHPVRIFPASFSKISFTTKGSQVFEDSRLRTGFGAMWLLHFLYQASGARSVGLLVPTTQLLAGDHGNSSPVFDVLSDLKTLQAQLIGIGEGAIVIEGPAAPRTYYTINDQFGYRWPST
jgi:hypothetical protein